MRPAHMRAISISPACMSRRSSSRRLNAIFARNRLLAFAARRSRRDGVFRRAAGRRPMRPRRLRGFAHPLPRRRVARASDRLRAGALAQARRRGQALDVRSGASFTLEVGLARQRHRRRRVHRRAGGQRASGRPTLIAQRLDLPPIAGMPICRRGSIETRCGRADAIALPRAGRSLSREDGTSLRLTHRTPRPWAHVMANEDRRRRGGHQ